MRRAKINKFLNVLISIANVVGWMMLALVLTCAASSKPVLYIIASIALLGVGFFTALTVAIVKMKPEEFIDDTVRKDSQL